MSVVTYFGEFPEGQVDEEGKPFIVQQGYTFHPGEGVKVTDKHDLLELTKNRFFKAPDSDKEEIEQAKAEAEAAEEQTLRGWLQEHQVPVHHRAGLKALRDAKNEYLLAQAAAAEG